MPRLLSYYIFKEILVPFLLTLAILTAVVLLSKTLKLVELVVAHGVGLDFIFLFVVSIVPTFFVYTIPIAFLVAVLIACTRLSSDSEITAMKASGVSLFSLAKPVMIFAVGVYGITLFTTLFLYPWGNFNVKRLLFDMARTKTVSSISEKIFYDRFDGVVLYADHITPGSGIMKGVFITQTEGNGKENVIFAEKGRFAPSLKDLSVSLILEDGTMHRMGEDNKSYHLTSFESYSVALRVEGGLGAAAKRSLSNRELPIGALKDRIVDYENRGSPTAQLIVDIHKRFALPAAAFIFALLGVPLGIQKVRSARLAGFSVAIGVVLIYYILFKSFEALGENGVLKPALSIWATNIIMGLVGIHVFYRAAKDKESMITEWVAGVGAKVGTSLRRSKVGR